MILVLLVTLGLIFGSFTNALVWRLREQSIILTKKKTKANKAYLHDLSISKGRSMCPHCKRELGPLDLIPVFSWISLGGKCRYCNEPISPQYPLIELAMTGIFVLSYIYWPFTLHSPTQIIIFGLWLLELVGFMALVIYDFRWLLLPNRIIHPLTILAVAQAAIATATAANPVHILFIEIIPAVLVGGGIFYILFQVSNGKWIGGGDVKLGWLLGITAGTAAQSVLLIFIAAVGGTIASIPLLLSKKLQRSSVIPFGPFLILGAIVVRLFGTSILTWYQHLLRFNG
jgi:prepilin signal peptidase PulO-like enzyme (type II secretory pathway)